MTWSPTCEVGTTPGIVPAGWTDVSTRLLTQDFGTVIGRRDEFTQPSTATCRLLLDNQDGNWDAGIPPNTAVRLTASDAATTVDLFYGIVESAPAVWPMSGDEDHIDAQLVGPEAVLARDETAVGPFPQQLTGARIAALLDLAGWPAGLRDLDAGVVHVEATDEPTSVNVLNEIRQVAQLEDGVLWVAPDGTMTFRGRHARLSLPVTATFDVVSAETFADLQPAYSDAPLWTTARVELANGDVYEQTDAVAAADYGRRVLLLRDLEIPWYEVNALASWRVRNYAEPRRRLVRLAVGLENTAAPLLGLGDLIEVHHTRPSGAIVTEQASVEQVNRGLRPEGFVSVYALSPYFGTGPWMEWLADGDEITDGGEWLSDSATEGAAWAP